MKITQALLDGYLPQNLLARDLGIESRDFKKTSLEKIEFKNTVLVKIPLSAVKFITSKEYLPAVIEQGEDESKYDYILSISPKLKIGFWK